MSRPWIPVGVVACCVALAVVIAGWPDRHKDEPLAIDVVSTTGAPVVTTTAPASEATSAAPTATAAPTTAVPARSPANVHVIAFNASAVPGSAGRVSTRLKTLGYAVGSAGPDRKPARDASAVMYRPGLEAEAKVLATGLGLDATSAQAAEAVPTGWGNADIAVLIGNELARRI